MTAHSGPGALWRRLLLVLLLPIALHATGCTTVSAPVKVVFTPVTVVRDVVDAPLVSLATVFNEWGNRFDPFAPPQPGVGWTWSGGFDFGIFYGVGFFVFKGLAGIVGGVDYVVCRSLFPKYPVGLSPWKRKDQSWGDLYFPNTRSLWGGNPPRNIWQEKPPPATSGHDPPG